MLVQMENILILIHIPLDVSSDGERSSSYIDTVGLLFKQRACYLLFAYCLSTGLDKECLFSLYLRVR